MIRARRHIRETSAEALRAAAPAAILSGIPSTLHALTLRRDPLEATVAAGSILLPREHRRGRLLLAAVPVHLAVSAGWAFVLASVLPRRNPLAEGILAGLGIAVLDLAVIGRVFPRIKNLDPLPQLADHIAYGVIVAGSLARHQR